MFNTSIINNLNNFLAYGMAVFLFTVFQSTNKINEGQSSGRAYYMDAQGSDSNDGSKSAPWKSIQRLNSVLLKAGDTVLFAGGNTFNGHIKLDSNESGTWDRPLIITSHGSQRATIYAGNGTALSLYGNQNIHILNLQLHGSGRKEGNTENGMIIYKAHNIFADSLEIKGFQKAGLLVYVSSEVELNRVHAHENGFAGISISGTYGAKDCKNVKITNCIAENNPGDPSNKENHSGNGIVSGNCRNILIDKCIAYNNGWDMPRIGNGPVGIWCFEADSVVIQQCISYANKTSAGGEDGGGFDLDGGVTHSTIHHCLTYDNQGSGFGIFQYAGAGEWHHNTICYNISRNDGNVSAAHAGVYIWNSAGTADVFHDLSFYNNVIYNEKGAAISYARESKNARFAFYNNIFLAKDTLVKGQYNRADYRGNDWWSLDSMQSGERVSEKIIAVDTNVQSSHLPNHKEAWLDTDGKPINAHGAGVLFHGDTYYLYGEIKKGTTWLVPGQNWEDYRVPAGGISCYSSKDLKKWKFERIALSPVAGEPENDLDTSRVIERPKVIYNVSTKKFVMWMHIDKNDYSYSRLGVAVSDSAAGPYHYLKSVWPNGQTGRDMTLYKDDDGKAYLIYASEKNATMQVCLLSDNYLSPTTSYSRILVNRNREAPAIFKNRSKYYLVTSGCTGWSPNAASYAVANSPLGPWKEYGNPCIGTGAEQTFMAQGTFILPMKGKPDEYLFMTDIWKKTDLERSTYLWLPLKVSKGKVIVQNVEVK